MYAATRGVLTLYDIIGIDAKIKAKFLWDRLKISSPDSLAFWKTAHGSLNLLVSPVLPAARLNMTISYPPKVYYRHVNARQSLLNTLADLKRKVWEV